MKHFLFWFVQTLGYWSIAFLFIPLPMIKKLLPFTLIGGFVYTYIVQILAIHVFNIWSFPNDILVFLGIPLFFVLSWTGVTLNFGYLLLRFTKYQSLIVFAFALYSAFMNYLAKNHSMIKHDNWSFFQTFMFGIFSHVLILYLLKFMYKNKTIGAMQP
jgi:hypothetical protein